MTILTVVGARPQFVKAAALSPVLRKRHREVLLHTGQHYDEMMSDRFFEDLAIPAPEIELGVGSGPHGQQTAAMLIGIEDAIARVKPGMMLLYGDTNSTLAGALAAAKLHLPIAHVEAGLRSFNRGMPEEINRVVTDRLSTLLFCPSETAVANLAREGITSGVHQVGDVMWEVLNRFSDTDGDAAVLERYGAAERAYCLATIHRAENTDDPFRFAAILAGLGAIPTPVILPAHPRLKTLLPSQVIPANVRVIDPVGYPAMVPLVRNAHVVVTDSGGLQKEAYWLGTPCVTVRTETEWIETVAGGWNVLAEPGDIADAASAARRRSSRPPLYGEGAAVEQIVTVLGRAL